MMTKVRYLASEAAWMEMEVQYSQFIKDTGLSWPEGDDSREVRNKRFAAWGEWLAERRKKEAH